LSYKRNAIASRCHSELLSAATYEIHYSYSGQFAAFYYGRELLFSFREAEKYRLVRDSAFNRCAYLNEEGLLALLFRSMTIRRFYPFPRLRYVIRMTSVSRVSELACFRTHVHTRRRLRGRAGFLLTRVPQQCRLFSVDYPRAIRAAKSAGFPGRKWAITACLQGWKRRERANGCVHGNTLNENIGISSR